MENEIVILEAARAVELLKVSERECDDGTIERDVHTQLNPSAGIFIGANWSLEDAAELFAENGGAEVTGPIAQRMGYGLCVRDKGRRVFFETAVRTDGGANDGER